MTRHGGTKKRKNSLNNDIPHSTEMNKSISYSSNSNSSILNSNSSQSNNNKSIYSSPSNKRHKPSKQSNSSNNNIHSHTHSHQSTNSKSSSIIIIENDINDINDINNKPPLSDELFFSTWVECGNLALSLNSNSSTAIKCFQMALNYFPMNNSIMNLLVELLIQNDLIKQNYIGIQNTINFIIKSINKYPNLKNDFELNTKLADYYLLINELEKSHEIIISLMEIDQNNPNVWLILGKCLKKMNLQRDSINAFTNSLYLLPKDLNNLNFIKIARNIHLELVQLAIDDGDLESARNELGSVLSLPKPNDDLTINLITNLSIHLIVSFKKSGNYLNAIWICEIFQSLFPDNQTILLFHSYFLLLVDHSFFNPGLAINFLHKSYHYDPYYTKSNEFFEYINASVGDFLPFLLLSYAYYYTDNFTLSFDSLTVSSRKLINPSYLPIIKNLSKQLYDKCPNESFSKNLNDFIKALDDEKDGIENSNNNNNNNEDDNKDDDIKNNKRNIKKDIDSRKNSNDNDNETKNEFPLHSLNDPIIIDLIMMNTDERVYQFNNIDFKSNINNNTIPFRKNITLDSLINDVKEVPLKVLDIDETKREKFNKLYPVIKLPSTLPINMYIRDNNDNNNNVDDNTKFPITRLPTPVSNPRINTDVVSTAFKSPKVQKSPNNNKIPLPRPKSTENNRMSFNMTPHQSPHVKNITVNKNNNNNNNNNNNININTTNDNSPRTRQNLQGQNNPMYHPGQLHGQLQPPQGQMQQLQGPIQIQGPPPPQYMNYSQQQQQQPPQMMGHIVQMTPMNHMQMGQIPMQMGPMNHMQMPMQMGPMNQMPIQMNPTQMNQMSMQMNPTQINQIPIQMGMQIPMNMGPMSPIPMQPNMINSMGKNIEINNGNDRNIEYVPFTGYYN